MSEKSGSKKFYSIEYHIENELALMKKIYSIEFLDKFIAFNGLLFLSPVFIVISAIILLDSRGPVFFRQVRIGKDLKKFLIYKFRTMYHDESRFTGNVASTLDINSMKALRSSFVTTGDIDNRVTKVGRLLRVSSLDELPQLINVLVGDMSIVGPRPDTPIQEVDYYPSQWKIRHSIKPGITGLAQVTGRGRFTTAERVELDLLYISRRSTNLYLRIIFRTIIKVLLREGAS